VKEGRKKERKKERKEEDEVGSTKERRARDGDESIRVSLRSI